MTVMEVCHYGKFDIEFFFHRFLPFPNFFVSYGKFPKRNSELSLFIKCIELNSINGL